MQNRKGFREFFELSKAFLMDELNLCVVGVLLWKGDCGDGVKRRTIAV
jgi:hypothetical protein